MDEYREKVLKAIRDYEKQFDYVDQYEITNAIAELYEIIRVIRIPQATVLEMQFSDADDRHCKIVKLEFEPYEEQMIEPQKKKEIRNQIEYIREFLEDHQENWYVYETLQAKLRQLEIMLEQEQVI